MKIYVEAKSKADLIRRLSAGEEISGYNYSIFWWRRPLYVR